MTYKMNVVCRSLMGLLFVALALCAVAADDKAQIQKLYADWSKAFIAKDINGVMAFYNPEGFFVFDVSPPREYTDVNLYKKDYEGFFAAFPGPTTVKLENLDIT